MDQPKRNISPAMAGVLSFVFAGAGQFYCGRRRKAAAFAAIEAAFIIALATFIWPRLRGLVTLQPTAGLVDSRHILLAGILAAMASAVYVWFHLWNIVDAARGAARRAPGIGHTRAAETSRLIRGLSPYAFIAPAVVFAGLVIVVPLIFGIALAFTNYSLYNCPPAKSFSWVGLANFKRLLTGGSSWRAQLSMVLGWNLFYATAGTVLAFAAGFMLAMALEDARIRGKRAFRAILMLPWAVPATVSVMVFFGMFNTSFGPINAMLSSVGLKAVPWFQTKNWARAAVIIAHVWISTPFNLSIVSAALQSVPREVYEAACVDGARGWQQFSFITFPLVMSVVAPVAVLMFAGNFNNFGIIYLLTSGGPAVAGSRGAGATDILMTWIYNLAFQQLQWSMASALAVLVFIFVVILSMVNFRLSGVLRDLRMEE